ncbi:MAG TPA: DUF4011 domain-containing protein, partial [Sphingomicrobium sp.]|nr:DUF4011 domain-containing protein [Sphingomicrobium sp.]
MSEDILVDPQDEAPAPDAEEDAGSSGAVFDSMLAALRDARDKLLDRSLRNKLINTPIESARARQVRVFDEKSEEVFALLQSGKQMTFLAARAGNAEEAIEGEDEVAWIPPEDDDPDERGVAARHRDTRLQTRLTAEGLQKRLTSLFYEGQTLEEEQGINVLFLALGFLEWREAKQSEIARFAPLVLLPVDLVRDGAKDRFKLHLRPDDLIANVSLQAWMAEQFGIELPELPDAEELSLPGYFAAVRDAIGIRDGWAVRDNEIILGFFSFAKFLLWRDLDPSKWPQPGMLLEHPLLKQILLRSEEEIPDVPLVSEDDRLDDLFKPSELIHITDADSSQAIAIQEVMSGKNLVIQGPPGTGKSQTITNIIAGAVQRGKRVLFVAEKMAALEVVHDRLVDKKLGPICLELHSRKSSKAQVLAQIKEGREVAAPPAWPPAVMSVLQEAQDKLRAHSDLMHAGADRISAFDLIGRMSLLRAKDTPVPNFAFPEGSTWTAEDVSSASVRAQQLGERLARAGIPAVHPWRGVGVNAPDILEQERLKPLVSAFLAAAARLQTANEASASALGFLDEIPVARLGSAAAALRHLSARPNKADALLGDARVRGRAAWLKEAAQTGLRLNAAEALLRSSIRPECWAEDWGRVRRTVAGRGRSFLRFLDSEYRAAVAELRGVWVGEFPKSFAARVQVLDQLVER